MRILAIDTTRKITIKRTKSIVRTRKVVMIIHQIKRRKVNLILYKLPLNPRRLIKRILLLLKKNPGAEV